MKECECPVPGTHNKCLAILVSEDNAFQAASPLEEWRGSAIQLSSTPAISRLMNYFSFIIQWRLITIISLSNTYLHVLWLYIGY